MTPPIYINSVPNQLDFVQLLPLDWQEALAAEGKRLDNISQISGLFSDFELLGGGIVFSSLLAGATDFEKLHADYLFKTFGNYIGFVWIRPDFRGKRLGVEWFLALFKRHPSSGFWLSIEEESLLSFYTKLGFHSFAIHIDSTTFQEQILVYQPR